MNSESPDRVKSSEGKEVGKKLSRGPAWSLDEILASSHHKDCKAEVLTDVLPASITNMDDDLLKGG